jgi:hypothetical protein
MLYLLGLTDDYLSDGHVITQALSSVPARARRDGELGEGYDQINSSVGQFATDTLIADSKALASGSASDDSAYAAEQETLQRARRRPRPVRGEDQADARGSPRPARCRTAARSRAGCRT